LNNLIATLLRFSATPLSLLAASLFIWSGLVNQSSAKENITDRPNIILILSDDQRFDDLGVAGNEVLSTPNLDMFANQGVRFTNAFVTSAMCAPSRASLLTGQYMSRHGVRDFATPLSRAAFDLSFPALLRKFGYRTGFIGKFAIGSPETHGPELALPADRFDFWFGFPQDLSYYQEVNGHPIHLTRLLADTAIEFLKSNPPNRPFFLGLSFKAPHGPHDYFDPDLPDWYAKEEFSLPENFSERIYESHPEFLKNSLNGFGDRDAQEFITNRLHAAYRLITGMDIAIGRLLRAVDELGIEGQTTIIFSSDNGDIRGNHALKGKWIPYEEAIRVPLLIRDPRTPLELRGTTNDKMVLNVDLAPTILSMAGLSAPPSMQGKDLGPLLVGESGRWRSEWFYEHTYARPPDVVIARSEAVRSDSWKYIRYLEKPPFEQLFDLHNDPGENHNLAGDLQYRDTLEDMRHRLDHLRSEAL
jgi:arylsulfatase A-like enzyme